MLIDVPASELACEFGIELSVEMISPEWPADEFSSLDEFFVTNFFLDL